MTNKKYNEVDLNKWVWFNTPKNNVWITYHMFENIISNSKYIPDDCVKLGINISDNITSIKYIYSNFMTEDELISLLEGTNGKFYLIYNKKDKDIKSTIYCFDKIKDFIKYAPNYILVKLNIKHKIKNMTDNYPSAKILPYNFNNNGLDLLIDDKMHLDLTNFFDITEENFNNSLENIYNKVLSMSIDNNIKLKKYEWINHFKSLSLLNICNMAFINDKDIESICGLCADLKTLNIMNCRNVDIGCVKSLGNINKLVLFDDNMVCQPNVYSSVLSEKEWNSINNIKLETFIILSDNLSLDNIDYFNNAFKNLKYLTISNKVFENLKKNIIYDDITNKDKIYIININGKKESNNIITLGRNFVLNNLYKNSVQTPYSNSMLEKMKNLEEIDLDKIDPKLLEELEQEVIKEMEQTNTDLS